MLSQQPGPGSKRARQEFKALQMLQKHAVPVPAPLYLDEQGTLLGMWGMVTSFVTGKQVMRAPDVLGYAWEMARSWSKFMPSRSAQPKRNSYPMPIQRLSGLEKGGNPRLHAQFARWLVCMGDD